MSEPADRLADVVIDLLVVDGFEGISVRRVATAAGVSIGAVQHHFRTKDAMVEAAMRRVSERFQERLDRQLSRVEEDPQHALAVVCDELLGIGDEQRRASVIWLQRLARAAVDPAVANRHAEDWQQIEQLLAALVGLIRPDRTRTWHRERAAALLALLDGLAAAVVTEPDRMPSERARRLLGTELERLTRRDEPE